MKQLLGQLKVNLKVQKGSLYEMNKEQKKNPNIEDDTEWVNDWYFQKGHVDALESVIETIKGLDKKKKK